MSRTLKPSAVLGAAWLLFCAMQSAAPAAAGAASPGCDIRIWQRGIYSSEAPGTYGAFGALGGVLQAAHDSKYPAASIEGLMEQEFNIDALPAVLKDVAWRDYTGREVNRVTFEREAVSNAGFKALKQEVTRRTPSPDDCYIEIYVGKQTFAGGSLKSHLFSDFYARAFYGARFATKTAILFDQTRKVRVTDAQSLDAARETFRTAFANTLTTFLQDKLPKP